MSEDKISPWVPNPPDRLVVTLEGRVDQCTGRLSLEVIGMEPPADDETTLDADEIYIPVEYLRRPRKDFRIEFVGLDWLPDEEISSEKSPGVLARVGGPKEEVVEVILFESHDEALVHAENSEHGEHSWAWIECSEMSNAYLEHLQSLYSGKGTENPMN